MGNEANKAAGFGFQGGMDGGAGPGARGGLA